MTKRGSVRFLFCLLALAVVSLIPSGAQSERPKNICKATHLGIYTVAISCTNGSDPTGRKLGETLLISCGKVDETQTAKK
jgi:hypothetical protein